MGAPSPPVLDSDCAYPKEAAERAARRTAEKRMVKKRGRELKVFKLTLNLL